MKAVSIGASANDLKRFYCRVEIRSSNTLPLSRSAAVRLVPLILVLDLLCC